jgi:hypothetical protein
MVCKVCATEGHLSANCPELYAPLYGKLGEGATKGSHGHDEECLSIGILTTQLPYPLAPEDTASNDNSMQMEKQRPLYIHYTL